MKELSQLKHLTSLDLNGTPVTDAGLKELTAFKELTWLHLSGHVTDASLEQLKGYKKLSTIYVGSSRMTKTGAAELQKALPDCRVIR